MAKIDKADMSCARVKQYTASDVSKAERHNERKNETYENMNVIVERIPFNVHFKKPTAPTYMEQLKQMEADGQVLTIHTSEPKPALLNYLGDPYGCIIDVDAGFDDGIVAGTGPYIATDCQSGDHLTLVKNENYWNGTPHIDELTIKTITDGNTLANALLSGEIQAAYGMAYESYTMYENDNFNFSQISASRCFLLKINFNRGSVCSDPALRNAIA